MVQEGGRSQQPPSRRPFFPGSASSGEADLGGVPLFEMRRCGACEISVLQAGKVAKDTFVGNLAVFPSIQTVTRDHRSRLPRLPNITNFDFRASDSSSVLGAIDGFCQSDG